MRVRHRVLTVALWIVAAGFAAAGLALNGIGGVAWIGAIIAAAIMIRAWADSRSRAIDRRIEEKLAEKFPDQTN